jgi:predicted  nucleic acid-binding Zn-ribbon protein
MNVSYYLDSLNKTIQAQVDLLNAYKKRIEINKFKQVHLESSLTEEELNEITISTLKTMAEIETLENVIAEKKNYFENYAKHFEKDLNEANEKWDKLIEKTRVMVKLKPHLQQFLDAINNIDDINVDLDKKVFIYKRLKPLVNG